MKKGILMYPMMSPFFSPMTTLAVSDVFHLERREIEREAQVYDDLSYSLVPSY